MTYTEYSPSSAPDMGQYQIFVQYQYQNFLKSGFQNQYQYQNSSKSLFNIKININIKISPYSISKSISKFFKVKNQYQNWYQNCQNIDIDIENQKILGQSLLFNLLWLLCHLGHHLKPIEPQREFLTLGPIGPIVSHLWPDSKWDFW